MADFLAAMKLSSERRVRFARRHRSEARLRELAESAPSPPSLRLSDSGFDILAEVKRRAPSGVPAGRRPGAGSRAAAEEFVDRLARAYSAGGAVAVSVLTEPIAFDGSLDDLELAASILDEVDNRIPVMRKDFLVSPYQMFEARAAGAGGALLIADMLDDAEARALVEAAAGLGMWLLIEAFADEHVERAVGFARQSEAAGSRALIGVNARDLRTLEVDPDRFSRTADLLPEDIPAVAESGLHQPSDAAAAAAHGFRLALVGSCLVAAGDPRSVLEELLTAGRAVAGGSATRSPGDRSARCS